MALALTTTFTPSAFCTEDIYYFNASCSYDGTTTVDPYSCGFYHLGPKTSSSACLPSSWDEAVSSTLFYAPGVCPTGYEEACKSQVVDAQGSVSIQAVCCPSGYGCQTGYVYPWFSTDVCSSHMPSSKTYAFTMSISGKGWVTSTTFDQQGLNAHGVPIEYASATSSLSSSSASNTTTPAASNTPNNTNTASSGSGSGLSSGAKAGIGIGVGIGGIAIIAAICAFFVARRRRANKAHSATPIIPDGGNAPNPKSGYHDSPTSGYGGNLRPGSPAPTTNTITTAGYNPSITSYAVSEMGSEITRKKVIQPGSTYTYELAAIQEPVAELPAQVPEITRSPNQLPSQYN